MDDLDPPEPQEVRFADCDVGSIVRELKRIADALEAQPSLRDQMAMAALVRGNANFTQVYEQADVILSTRHKEE